MLASATDGVADMIDQYMRNDPPSPRRFGYGEATHEMAHADRVRRFGPDE
jgi:hypothetical protein